MMKRFVATLAPLALIAGLLSIWELACHLLNVPSYFLPPPTEIIGAGIESSQTLFSAAARTLVMALAALVLVSILGTGFALTLSLSLLMERTFRPVAIALQVTPIVAIAPLAVIWAGLDHPEREYLIALVAGTAAQATLLAGGEEQPGTLLGFIGNGGSVAFEEPAPWRVDEDL